MMESGSWDFPRAAVSARLIFEVGLARGVPTTELLLGTRLSSERLRSADQLVEGAEELALARNLVRCVGNEPGLGIEAAERYTLGSAGILGFALISSPTLGDALAICLRYVGLSSSFVSLSFEQDAREARIHFDDSEIPADIREFFVERDLAVVGQIMPMLAGGEVTAALTRLEIDLPAERGKSLATLFPVPEVLFSKPRNTLVFPSALLDQPLPQADPATAELCERQCRDLLDRRSEREGIGALVRARLLRMPSDPPSMETVAAELNVSVRGLRRQLDEEGTSFRALATEVRETLAVELLSNTGLTVEEVSLRLGYADTASFTHAFTRWRGKPPSSYRKGRPTVVDNSNPRVNAAK